MKFIIIRHGERFDSTLYFTPLTSKGLRQADALVDILKNLKIDIIYSSPFLRTLQTIYPYCIKNNKRVNAENSFYECLDSDEFNYHNYRHEVSELKNNYPHLVSIINDSYRSKLFVSNISHVEDYKQVKNRVFPFIYHLCQEHKNDDTVILIVTHATIVNTIRKFFDSDVLFGENVEEAKPFIIDVPENFNGPSGYC
jgi:broad specificity phosphatase PhoE